MILFLTGPDSYRLQQRLNILKNGFASKYDKAGFNIETLYGESLTRNDFRKAILSSGLFSKKRLLIIKNIFLAKDEIQKGIVEDIQIVDQENVIIFIATEKPKDKNNQLYKKLLKVDKVEDFPLLKPGQIFEWIRTEVNKSGAVIESEAITFLVDAVGSDLWTIHNTLEKLISLNSRITLSDVKLFVSSPLDDNIFNFTDALSEKNVKRAMTLLRDQLEAGANEFYLLSMLARQIKILLQIKETNGQGLDLHPFVIRKALPQANKFSLQQLKNLYQLITQADEQLKTSATSSTLILNLLVVNICK
ncbi:MAG: DNA polymerase III subunit delta [Patescibacteria group bacterium]